MALQPTSSAGASGDDPWLKGRVNVGAQAGYIFEGAGAPAAQCFVPAACVERTADGGLIVDDVAYFLSGWSVRNARLASCDVVASFIFPDPARMLSDINSPLVRAFLLRIDDLRVAG